MSTYALNPELAKEGDQTGGNRISDTGEYIGVITLAYEHKKNSGTTAIDIHFKSDCGKEATLALYVANKNGEEIYGTKQFHALLACLKLRQISTQTTIAELWDYEKAALAKQSVEAFPELANKRIGLVLQRENYKNNVGDDRYRMLMFCPFDANTRQTATEILSGSDASALDKVVASCQDKQAKPRSNYQQAVGNHSPNNPPVDDFDDDIPF